MLAKELLQENLCYFIFKRYSNKLLHCSETSQQSIWSEVPQASTKGTPDTSDGKKDWAVSDVITIELLLNGRKCCLYLATCILGSHWVSILTRNML